MQLTMLKNINRYFLLLLAVLITVPAVNIYADGSKDLHPATTPPTKQGAAPVRALLYSSAPSSGNSSYYVFPNHGVHYVYAKPGERITLASSAQGGGSARIRMYAPNGTEVVNATSGGQITNRTQELQGPRLSGVTTGNGYTPIYYQVPAGAGGVYRVEFRGRTDGVPTARITYGTSWTQTNQGANGVNGGIIAWDVSVINSDNTAFIPGRVYTTILNLANGTGSPETSGFYGKVYVRTRDGYTYLVDNNGSNGICYSFFVNNNGFINADGSPQYKSLNYLVNASSTEVQNPDLPDTDKQVTHKMFYTKPATDLPPTAQVTLRTAPSDNASANTTTITTWLKNEVKVPTVEEVKLVGAEGIEGQVSNKGGNITFQAGSQGNYRITIESTDTPKSFYTRMLTGASFAGDNIIYWDGKAGTAGDPTQPGLPLPAGSVPARVTVQLQGAEVHFPFFDMEYNKNGIIIELLDHTNLDTKLSDIVYWDDRGIQQRTNGTNSSPQNNSHLPPANSAGLSSITNGHIWGVGATGTGNQFGDSKSIDTWTFIKGEEETIETPVSVRIADLKVTEISHNKGMSPVEVGDVVIYTVKVKNGEAGDGNSDITGAPFTFTPPAGFVQEAAPVFTTLCDGSESTPVAYNPLTESYESVLNLKNGCEITYTFTLKISNSATPESAVADATILRPNDVTDPDATNTSDPEKELAPADQNPFDLNFDEYFFPPTDPYFECEHNGLDACNNIKSIPINIKRISDLGIEKSVDNLSPDVGEVVTFTLTVTNHGPHNALNVVVTDIVPDGYTDIANIDNDGVLDGNTITWNITELENTASKTLSFKAKVVNDGDYTNTATVTGDSEDPNPENNEDAATVVPCEELNIFWEDFGTSNFGENLGRTTSPYMPSESFTFGTPYPQSNVSNETAIDNDHYAVVAPGYIKAGWKTEDLGWYFWTPAYDEENTVTDRSGEVDGAVMVINAGNTLKPFYERHQLLQVGATYRASFWLYLMKGDSRVAIDVKHAKTGEVLATITSDILRDWDPNVKSKWTYIDLYFTVPVPDDKENCEVDNVILSFRNDYAATFGNDYYIDDISLDKVCSPPPGTIIINCPDPDYMKNYWHGTIDNDWNKAGNWTANFVPGVGEDIIFATDTNNGASGDGNGEGAAVNDLYLDNADQNDSGGRIIGNLINDSEVDLVITAGNQLIINGEVTDDNAAAGTIVVKSTNIPTDGSDPVNAPTGTLIVNPAENPEGVRAVVEFYNQAYDCEDCGFYTRSWQYFGIPVKESGTTPAPLPFTNAEEVNEWSEPTNGDKWIDPDMPLTAFTGYQITRNETSEPDHTNAVHRFDGGLNIGDATVGLTRTDNVNYPGVNLVGNSYTAAIPISQDALTFPSGVQQTVYLFNTGTRDQWRKLNGSVVNEDGYRSGQYLAVPVNLGGQDNFPDRIPSMHAFMVLAESGSGGNLGIDYSKLVKNTEVNRGNGEQIVTRSTNNEGVATAKSTIPSLVMDVIGEESADRVWIFVKEGTSYGFDNGWDGRKMSESGITQLYVADDTDKDRFQVATVPGLDNVTLGFEADTDGEYTIEFALSDHWTTEEIYLHDLGTGTQERVMNRGSYIFEAKKGDSGPRFRLSYSGDGIPGDDESAKITVNTTGDSKIAISNNSSSSCTVFVSDTGGKLLQQLEVRAGSEQMVENITRGIYIVRLQNAIVNDVRKVLVE